MDDDEYDRIVDPDGPPPWIKLLDPHQRAWRANQILKGRNPDPYIEERLREAGTWPEGGTVAPNPVAPTPKG